MDKFLIPMLEKTLAPLIEQVRTGSITVYVIITFLAGGLLLSVESFQHLLPEWVSPIALQVLGFVIAALANPENDKILAKHAIGRYNVKTKSVSNKTIDLISLAFSIIEKPISLLIDKLRTGSMVAYVITIGVSGGIILIIETVGDQFLPNELSASILEFLAFLVAALTNPIRNESILAKHKLGKYWKNEVQTKSLATVDNWD